MTPIARELLAPSLDPFGRSLTLPAEAYTDWSVFRWEQEHFFDESWVCAGRTGELAYAGDGRVVAWHGWSFANASGNAPAFGDHVGNLEELIRNYDCAELVVGRPASRKRRGNRAGFKPAQTTNVHEPQPTPRRKPGDATEKARGRSANRPRNLMPVGASRSAPTPSTSRGSRAPA